MYYIERQLTLSEEVIMKVTMTLFIVGLLGFVLTSSAFADTNVSGTVSGLWDAAGSPYIVQGDLFVPADSVLIIEPGVTVIFEDNYEFEVNGIVEAIGAEEDSIYFTTDPGITWGGFIYQDNADTSSFTYCLFENADTSPSGYGGVFYLYQSNAIVEHSTFQHNEANRGAAMYSLWGHVQFRYNVCWDNQVDIGGGAINFGNDENSVVEYCVFHDNSSGLNGGAIYFWDDHCQVLNCTVVQNSSPAVLSSNGSTSSFVNCIFWDNTMGSVYSATYSDIGGGWPGIGNINEDPQFVDPDNDDFHLLANSPCIDAGNPGSPADPDGTIADMGAYYFDQPGFVPGNLTMYAEPLNPPVVIPPEGGSFDFVAAVTCDLTNYAVFDVWAEIILPNGQSVGPKFLREGNLISAGDSLSRELDVYVSPFAMPGTYEYWWYAGDYPDSIYTSAYFIVEKEAPSGSLSADQDAYALISGWDQTERIELPSAKPNGVDIENSLYLSSSPNPFNPVTSLSFTIPVAGHTKLTIYNLAGQVITTLLNREIEGGSHRMSFDGSHLASGIYLALLESGQLHQVERLLLIK
ncbi:hypothetical protein CEE37_01525 [candidate division LCP-89 bacterium B3_LCP]|uniref:Right handed beta helix domain-containing protein n=1 Tax=candidate division LCP-89 bacterium B3_LCP TaxID=2012998 RepID=A0A532V5D3_UNCL8|nr:MAG: hypothetical protein CEE37_01525 [candidate division LCP-89 bacterium B3_LCP]